MRGLEWLYVMACQRNGRRGAGHWEGDRFILVSAEGMTMIRASWAAAAAGVLALSAGGARAGDVVRLNGTGDARTVTLADDGLGADTQPVRHGFGGGGFRGGF